MVPEEGTAVGNNEALEDLEGLPGVADTANPEGLMADDLDEMERQRESEGEPIAEEEPEETPELEPEEEESNKAPTEEESSETFTVDDKTYTADQIRELEADKKRMQVDYTKKTQAAAEVRREAEEVRANFQSLVDEATGSNNFEQQRRQPTVRQTVTDDEFATPAEKALSQQVNSLAHEMGEIKRQGVVDKETAIINNMRSTAENFRKANDLSDEEMGNIIGRINDVKGVITPYSLEMSRRSMLDPETLKQEGVKEYLKQKDADKEETKNVTSPTSDDVAPKAFDARNASESELDEAMLKDPVF